MKIKKKIGINWSISYYFDLILMHLKGVKVNTNSSSINLLLKVSK